MTSRSAAAQQGDTRPVAGPRAIDEALAPTREALLRAAHRDADECRAAAEAEAESLLEQARSDAAGQLEAARAQGREEGEARAERARHQARRERRQEELRVQREVYQSVVDAVHEQVRSLVHHPAYPQLRDALERELRRRLGPSAVVVEADEGGMCGEDGERSIDFSLDAYADRALDAGARTVAGLWD